MKNIGIIGCGRITQTRHIPEYLDNNHVKIMGFYDINQERAESLAKKYDAKSYGSYEELLADQEIDALSVCAINELHAEISIAALNAGKHVLCEKPMAISLEDCERMVDAAEKNGKFLMIGQNQRLTKAHKLAKQLIQKKEIGDVLTFKTSFGHGGPETWSIDPGKNTWFFDKKRASMGAMADLGIHKTDLIQYLLQDIIVETMAQITTLDKKDASGELIQVDDNAICIYKMKSGVIGTMTASWTNYGIEDNSTILYGTGGIMYIYDDPAYSIKIVKSDGSRILYDIDQIQTNDNQTKSGVIDEFVKSLIENKEPDISGKSVLTAMRAVFASIESSETGKMIKVDQ